MAISEIEKLERRYAENPQGLTFAPLAEAYRKSGDPERALTILRPGLDLHPDYIPASIVLGRCQLDLGDEGGAEAAFGHVLSLDPENVIALKALADLSERGGRLAESAERLRQLLEVDRSNDDAREQLARVEDAIANAPPAAEPEAEAVAVEPLDESPVVPELVVAENDVPAIAGEPAGTPVEALSLQETALPVVPMEPVPTETVPAAEWVEPVSEPTIERIGEAPILSALADEPPAPWSADEIAGGEDEVVVIEPDAAAPIKLDVTQLGSLEADELELRSAGGHEFQLPSASEEFAGGTLEVRGNASSEFQLPDASAEFTGVSLTPASSASEYQAPDAAESLLAEVTGGASDEPPEPPEPPAPVEEERVADEPEPAAAEPSLASYPETVMSLVTPEAVVETPAPEPEPEPVIEEPAGEWVTWSDAALAEDAEPFPVDEPAPVVAAAAPIEAPVVEAPTAEAAPEVSPAAVEEAVSASAEALVSAPTDETEPDLVVTESMAELFVRQGHAADALRIYRELAGRRPGDARLAARIAELEQQEAAARAPLAPYSARVTGGTSVRELMQTVLTSRPNGAQRHATPAPAPVPTHASPAEGAPTRPAADHLSLSDVFGEEGPPLPPAFRSSRPPSDSGVSFDEFFGGEGTHAEGEPARTVRAPRPGDDDLDQFHAWLQNLKK